MLDFTEAERDCIEALAKRIIVWTISNQRAEVSFETLSDEISMAVFKRVVQIAQGAPFRVNIDPDKWYGVWGTNG